MNGIVVINKETGLTSRDCVNKLNRILGTKKIGHTGTLDPLAEGVLVMTIGSYTPLVDLITSLDKEYIATVKLGVSTDTLDITGNVLEEDNSKVTKEKLLDTFEYFTKEYEQTVPKYSAIKVNGRKLYEYAREGIEIELPRKLVKIFNIELLDFNEKEFTFKTQVSKGTYIRSLINDMCEYMHVLGTMTKLVRTKQGKFSIENSYKISDVENNNYNILTVEDLFDYKKIDGEKYRKLILNGNKLNIDLEDGNYFIILDNEVKAIYSFKNNEGKLLINI